ncbi:MAG: tetratricopeptide repeat protein [Acidobacteriota bacterium]
MQWRGLAWLACWLLGTAAAAAQVLPGEVERTHLQSELATYHAFVRAYQEGSAESLDDLSRWDDKRLRRVLGAIDSKDDDLRPWGANRFKAAAIMHVDAAVRLLNRAENDAALMQLETGVRLLQKGGPALRPYAGRWYQGVARLLRGRSLPMMTGQLLETARAWLPHDPTVLEESGMLEELLATDSSLPAVFVAPGFGATMSRGGVATAARLTTKDIEEARALRAEHLAKAAGWLRESLDAAPSRELARLHLGRVQSLREQYESALTLLAPVAASGDAATAYLACLFTGVVHERQGQFDAAAAAYRTAAERWPRNHAADVALSSALRHSGRSVESREALERVVRGRGLDADDPWRSYLIEPLIATLGRLENLRREARP